MTSTVRRSPALVKRIRYPYDWLRFHGLRRAVMHPYYWVKHYPDRRRYWKKFADQIAQDEEFDRTFGTDTASREDLVSTGVSFASRAHGGEYACINEQVFSDALSWVKVSFSEMTFVDLGSGKGKALLLAARFDFQRIIGVEFAQELSKIAEANVTKFAEIERTSANIECVYGDALTYEFPDSPLLVFLFNPFDEPIMQPVVERIGRSLKDHPRPLWVIYVNARFRALFDAAPFLEHVATTENFTVWQAAAAKGN